MGIKEKMMDNMMENMSKEDKMAMMNKMMDAFFGGMSDEEKGEMMSQMMPRMMGHMMGSGNPMRGMMGMMGKMMGGSGPGKEADDSRTGDGFNPMEMCQKMMSSMRHGHRVHPLATAEIQGLFEEWADQIEKEILAFVEENKNAGLDRVAVQFKISKESASYFLTRLAQKGKIDLQALNKE